MAYDLIEHAGADVREWPLTRRREALAGLITELECTHLPQAARLRLSPLVRCQPPGRIWPVLVPAAARLRRRA